MPINCFALNENNQYYKKLLKEENSVLFLGVSASLHKFNSNISTLNCDWCYFILLTFAFNCTFGYLSNLTPLCGCLHLLYEAEVRRIRRPAKHFNTLPIQFENSETRIITGILLESLSLFQCTFKLMQTWKSE